MKVIFINKTKNDLKHDNPLKIPKSGTKWKKRRIRCEKSGDKMKIQGKNICFTQEMMDTKHIMQEFKGRYVGDFRTECAIASPLMAEKA